MSVAAVLTSKGKLITAVGTSLLILGATAGLAVQHAEAQSAVLDHVTVAPARAKLDPGATQQYTAAAFDSSNTAISSGVAFTWVVTASGGTIDTAGLFTAGASAGTFANTIQVTAV